MTVDLKSISLDEIAAEISRREAEAAAKGEQTASETPETDPDLDPTLQ